MQSTMPHSTPAQRLEAPERFPNGSGATKIESWLLGDLQQVLDYCVQEGDYETVEAMLEVANRDGYTLECTAAAYKAAHME